MTRERCKELLPIMQAFAEGKEIEFFCCGKWGKCFDDLDFNSDVNRYRIKPEETYRPYKDCEEMIAEYMNRFKVTVYTHSLPLIWVKFKKAVKKPISELITGFHGNEVIFSNEWRYLEELFEDYTYLDGSPIGVKE